MEPIAVVGYSLRFPQEATSPEAFWKMLCEGRSTMSEVPKDRFNIDGFYHPDSSRNDTARDSIISNSSSATNEQQVNCRKAHFLKEDIAAFDAPFFFMNPNEVTCMDPQQRGLLETSYRALENSGIPMENVAGSNTSVYVGAQGNDYKTFFENDEEVQATYKAIGNSGAILSNRLSWFYDLRGPSMTIETACSSSLIALHLACQSLRTSESNMSLVCGSQLYLEPMTGAISLSSLGFISPDGCCHSFDERGNGYAKGEGFGVVVLKSLSNAIRDGDTIRGVVRATATNQDGKTSGISQPRGDAQAALIREAYRAAGLDLSATRFFEAHGTGTAVGDTVEARAFSSVFSEHRSPKDPLYVGALKSNIGHLEATAGIAGLIKTLLILEKGIIPPNYDFQKVNRMIPAHEWNIAFPTEVISWPTDGLRRASINAFGYGGANAHAVVDDAFNYLREHGLKGIHRTVEKPPRLSLTLTDGQYSREDANGLPNGTNGNANSMANGNVIDDVVDRATGNPMRIFVWSAPDAAGIERLAAAFKEYLLAHNSGELSDQSLHDLAYTLSEKRSSFPWKSYAVAKSVKELQCRLEQLPKPFRSSEPPRLQFIFTGQGAQWPRMGLELLCYRVFRESLSAADAYFRNLGCPWSILDELERPIESSTINDPRLAQPICTAVQIALIELLSSWAIRPSAVLGHSSGEIAAAYCIGALSRESSWVVAYYRGSIAARLANVESKERGAMMTTALSEANLEPYFAEVANAVGKDDLSVGCYNSPDNTTVTGLEQCIDALKFSLDRKGIFARKLKIPVAYHSRHMQIVADEYVKLLVNITPGNIRDTTGANVRFFSSVTGGIIASEELSQPSYWVRNLLSPVMFFQALRALHAFSNKAANSSENLHLQQENFFLEVGPHPALQRPVKDVLLNADKYYYQSTLRRDVSAVQTIGDTIGKLFVHGYMPNLQLINSGGPIDAQPKMLINLPEYPFNHSQNYWLESRIFRNFRTRSHIRHELLGLPTTDWNPLEPRFRHTIRESDLPWVKDHIFDGSKMYPAAGMLAMVVEASRFLANSQLAIRGYRFRDVEILNALLVPSGPEGVEVQLYIRDQKNKATTNSKSLDSRIFRLCAHSDTEWRDICTGSIVTEYEETPDQVYTGDDDRLSREEYQLAYETTKKHCSVWTRRENFYQAAVEMGSDFGPSFQTLHEIAYDAQGSCAAGKVVLNDWMTKVINQNVQDHVIHPTALDGVLQVAAVALTKGGTKRPPLMAPTQIRECWISGSLICRDSETSLNIIAENTLENIRDVDASIVALRSDTQEPAIILSGYRVTAVTGGNENQPEMRKAFYNFCWKPDVDLLDQEELKAYCLDAAGPIKPWQPEDDVVCLYYMSRALEELSSEGFKSPTYHLQKYLEWIKFHFDWMGNANPLLQSEWKSIFDDTERRSNFLEKYAASGREQGSKEMFCRHLKKIIREESDPLDLLFNQGLAKDMYVDDTFQATVRRISAYVDLLAHKNSGMDILEIGAGTGSGTHPILEILAQQGKHFDRTPRYARYTFTDISPSFFEDARKRFAHHDDRMTFRTLDIEKDPSKQGFELGRYDMVVAVTVLHATAVMDDTMRHVRSLLKPGGHLVLLEPTNKHNTLINCIWGTLPGWWRSTEEGRSHGPLMSKSDWDSLLQRSGFTGVNLALPDYEDEGHHVVDFILSQADQEENAMKPVPQALVVTNSTAAQHRVASSLASKLLSLGAPSCDVVSPVDLLKLEYKDAVCVSLLELDGSFLDRMTHENFKMFQNMIYSSSQVYWVTNGNNEKSSRPENAMASGFGRAIMQEKPGMYFAVIDVDDLSSASTTISKALGECVTIANLDQKDSNFMEKDGKIQIPRIVEASDINDTIHLQTSRPQPEPRNVGKEPAQPLELNFTSGRLDSLHYVRDVAYSTPLDSEEIEVQVKATGVNFVDVMVILGNIADDYIGQEYSGIVSRVGSSVTNARPGDRVCGIAKGAFKTYARSKSCAVIKIPESWSFTDASSFPAAFVTAHYGLFHLAQLRKGESILIHAAAGAVGQAAIQLAQLAEAEIFVTVSSTAKKMVLVERYHIPEDHFFSSRKLAFGRQILRVTNGRGVDVVLNSLSGEALVESWRCMAYLGRFVEIGKRDIRSFQSLPMWHFVKNVSFSSLDIQIIHEHRPDVMGQLMSELGELICAAPCKVFAPQPLSVFKRSEFEAAFRYLQTGHHMGKAVVDWEQEDTIQATPTVSPLYSFDENASYVIAGGLGGIGRSLALYFASRGVKNLILLSRSGAHSRDAQKLLQDLSHLGVTVAVPRCDIGSAASLDTALQGCIKTMPPVKGCIQGAMVLEDRVFENMTKEEWQAVLEPKVRGTWNLHEKLPRDLDFFVNLSSLGGITGAVAQSQYNAAANFQDAFARHRHSLGEKCVSIDIGVVTSVGYVAEHDEVARRWENSGLDILREQELHAVVDWACNPSRTVTSPWDNQIITAVGKPAELRRKGSELPPYMHFPLFRHMYQMGRDANGTKTADVSKSDYGALIREAKTQTEAGAIVAAALAKRLSRALSIPEEDVNLSEPVHTFGVDSLVAVELRFWFASEIKADVSVFNILGNNSIAKLGMLAAEKSEFFGKSSAEVG
ncbi:MAG: Type I Iterative PKS [Bogoriella megaspora]|nr:MAG: Type I Iterative PKS [Bogoriella megaspora]